MDPWINSLPDAQENRTSTCSEHVRTEQVRVPTSTELQSEYSRFEGIKLVYDSNSKEADFLNELQLIFNADLAAGLEN